MNDPAKEHVRPEHQPLQDARRHIACAQSALAAATSHAPRLGPDLGRLHADLADVGRRLEGVR